MSLTSCPSCRCETAKSDTRCSGCGVFLGRRCVRCGGEEPSSRNFCGSCGARLAPKEGEAGQSPLRPTSGSGLLRSERKRVTVLFADIHESTQLIEALDPEAAVGRIDPLLKIASNAIRDLGGVVSEVRGDGVMGLFGAPVAQEDHARRACHAALAIQSAVEALQGSSVQFRIGLNSGEVVVRAIPNDFAFDYTAVGSTVHLASRMESAARPGHVLMSDRTYRLAEGFVRTLDVGGVEAKGVPEPVHAYELVDVLQDRTPWEVRSSHGLGRFVGRDRELAELEKALARAASGHRTRARVSGTAGVGKSRLVHEFKQRAAAQGWMILEASGFAPWQSATYFPIRKGIVGWLGRLEDGSSEEMTARLRRRLESLGTLHSTALPALEAILDLPVSDPGWSKLSSDERRARIMTGVLDLVDHVLALGPTLLIYEDVQWMDEETRALVERIAAAGSPTALLLVETHRTDAPASLPESCDLSIELDSLPRESARRMLTGLMGDHPGLSRLVTMIVEKTGGIPLFLEETLKNLVETRRIRGKVGDYRPSVSLEALEIPDTVEAVIGARIDRLPGQTKRLLQICAVIENSITPEGVASVSGVDPAEVERQLRVLEDQDYLRADVEAGAGRLTFKQALTRQVAYDSLLRSERKALHQKVLALFEEAGDEGKAGAVEQLGYHAFRAEDWEKAAAHLEAAGAKAMGRSAHREAVSCYEDAIHAVESLPSTEERSRREIRLRLLLRSALIPMGDGERVAYQLEKAETSASKMGNSHWLGLVYANATFTDWLRGEMDNGIQSGLRAMAIAREVDDLTLWVFACQGLGLVFHGAGRFVEAVEAHRALLEKLTPELERNRFNGPGYPAVIGRAFLAYSHAELGDLDAAQGYATSAVELASEMKDYFGLALSRIGAGHVHLRRGAPQSAIRELERGVEECRRVDMPTLAVGVVAELALALAEVGRGQEAIQALADVVEVADDEQIPIQSLDRRLLALAKAHHATGAFDQALHFAEEARAAAAKHGDQGTLAWALLYAAMAEARRSGFGSNAPELFDRTRSLATELSLLPLSAHCDLELARAYRADGRPSEAHGAALEAARAFRSLGLDSHAAEAGELATAGGR
jgi:class 3 adenylate cyclase/tetratricopeptide (TPR) repeat protein